MHNPLPTIGKTAIDLTHFPTKQQAFIFRAYEYVPLEKIAKVLRTDVDTVRHAADEMGLPDYCPGDLWLKRGYITIIRRMWHILPYGQLSELMDMDEKTLARIMSEDDFLGIKLSDKPSCEKLVWRALNEEEKTRTRQIKKVMQSISISGKRPFEFDYDVPKLHFEGKERFATRMIYAFSGLYNNAFDVNSEEFLSDEQLKAYQALGINGIWTQGLLSQLSPFPFDPAVSAGYEKRLERLKAMTERLAKFGIKLYLYLNEPRALPLPFFKKHPELLGHIKGEEGCLCTSVPQVRDYLKNAVESVCRAAPLIGGFFTITRSENLTNCYSHTGTRNEPCSCSRCKNASVAEVISETINCFLEGAQRVDRNIKVFAWSWRWDEFNEDIIPRLPKDVILLSQSELDIPFEIGGVNGNVLDYSMSIIGPGERARREWKIARDCGLEVGAKVQINTTWEASTVPAIPVSPSVEKHMQGLQEEDVKHLLLSWTLGGYPCNNIATAAKYFFEKCDGQPQNSALYEAEKQFVEAFKEFPFHIGVLYYGPQNAGPSTLLFEKPTGYKTSMTCFAYDDLENWRAIYPLNTFEEQFSKLCEKWEVGLNMLDEKDDSEPAIMARAAYCLFKSSLNQIRFIRARDSGCYSAAVSAATDELLIAKKMLDLINKNAAIGYEAANHYYYSKGQLIEKIVNCNYIIDVFNKKITESKNDAQ